MSGKDRRGTVSWGETSGPSSRTRRSTLYTSTWATARYCSSRPNDRDRWTAASIFYSARKGAYGIAAGFCLGNACAYISARLERGAKMVLYDDTATVMNTKMLQARDCFDSIL